MSARVIDYRTGETLPGHPMRRLRVASDRAPAGVVLAFYDRSWWHLATESEAVTLRASGVAVYSVYVEGVAS